MPCPSQLHCLQRIDRILRFDVRIVEKAHQDMAKLTSNEESIPSEYCSIRSVLEIKADGILGVARRVQCFNRNLT